MESYGRSRAKQKVIDTIKSNRFGASRGYDKLIKPLANAGSEYTNAFRTYQILEEADKISARGMQVVFEITGSGDVNIAGFVGADMKVAMQMKLVGDPIKALSALQSGGRQLLPVQNAGKKIFGVRMQTGSISDVNNQALKTAIDNLRKDGIDVELRDWAGNLLNY